MSETESFYDILEVADNSSKSDIKAAYRKLSLKYHPDRNGGNDDCTAKFKKINEAYETLGDDQKREEYDETRNNPFFKMGMGGGMGPGAGELDDLLNSLASAFAT